MSNIDWDNIDQYNEEELEDKYESELNECYGLVDICGSKFDAGFALRQLDSIAFREGFNNWVDSEGFEEFEEVGMWALKSDTENFLLDDNNETE